MTSDSLTNSEFQNFNHSAAVTAQEGTIFVPMISEENPVQKGKSVSRDSTGKTSSKLQWILLEDYTLWCAIGGNGRVGRL